jgi:hypothetical protein
MSQLAPEAEVIQHSRVPAMRIKRKLVGGVAVVGVIVGAFLSGWIPGLGSGSGTGNGDSLDTPISISADPASQPTVPPATATNTAKPAAKPVTIETLDVYVHGRSFAVPIRTGGYRVVKPSTVMRLAKSTVGNDSGVRVRVLRTRDAQYTTWSRLVDELEKQLDMPSDAISIPEELVELPGEEIKPAT